MARDLVVRYEGDTAGADQAASKTRSQLTQTGAAAEAMSRRYEAAMKTANASGARVGDGLVKGIARATGGTILKGIGTTIGTGIANAAGRRLQQTNIYQSLAAKATAGGQQAGKAVATGLDRATSKVGQTAGTKIASGIQKSGTKVNWSKLRTPALIAAAVGLGVLFGRRFGNSAESSAQRSFQPSFPLGRLTSGLKYAALGVGAAVGGALGSAIALGGKRLDSIDSARGKLLGLGHDAQTVDAIMNDALTSVKGTAFGLDEAATLSATAVASGIKPGKELQRTLKLVADTATIGNTSLSESGSIFAKVASSNKVYNDTLNQLGDRGIPIVQLLGQEMGKSSDEVRDLASKGKIDFKTFQDALEGGLGGAALKSGDTFQGALKNSKAALGRFGAGLLKGVFPQLKGVFGDVTKGLDGLTPTATRIGATLGRVFSDLVGLAKSLGPVLSGVGRIASGAFDGFASSLGGGQGAIKGLTDFVSTHQADLTSFFVSAGHAAISFGKIVAVVVSGALRAYSGLQKGIQATLEFILSKTQAALGVAGAAAGALGLDKQAGQLAAAAGAVQKLRDNNAKSDAGAGIADKIADGIDDKLLPSLSKADAALTKVGQKEVGKAAQRDSAARFAVAVRGIGTAANGSQIKLKKWSDVTKLGASAQSQLRSRIKSAQTALRGQIDAQQSAGAGQKKLTRTWEQGRDKLAGEFRQMGLSRKEAQRLADKYAGIKPKVKTSFSTPGLPKAKSDAEALKSALTSIPKNIQIKINQSVATKGDRLLKNSDKNVGSATGGVWMPGPSGGGRVIRAAAGRVLPGFTPGRDVHRFFSATAGELDLSGGEAIMRPEFTRAVGGPSGVNRLNRAAESGELGQRLASGGIPILETRPLDASAPARSGGVSSSRVDELIDAIHALAARPTQVDVLPDYRGLDGHIRAVVRDEQRKVRS